MNFLTLLDEYGPYKRLSQSLKDGKTPISVSGVVEPAQAQLISALSEGRSALVVVYSDFEARRLAEDFLLYTDKVYVFCEKEYVYYNIDARDHNREFERLDVLSKISDGAIVIASVGACLSYTLPKEKMQNLRLKLKVGDEFDGE